MKLLIASTEYTLGSYVEKWEARFSSMLDLNTVYQQIMVQMR